MQWLMLNRTTKHSVSAISKHESTPLQLARSFDTEVNEFLRTISTISATICKGRVATGFTVTNLTPQEVLARCYNVV